MNQEKPIQKMPCDWTAGRDKKPKGRNSSRRVFTLEKKRHNFQQGDKARQALSLHPSSLSSFSLCVRRGLANQNSPSAEGARTKKIMTSYLPHAHSRRIFPWWTPYTYTERHCSSSQSINQQSATEIVCTLSPLLIEASQPVHYHVSLPCKQN